LSRFFYAPRNRGGQNAAPGGRLPLRERFRVGALDIYGMPGAHACLVGAIPAILFLAVVMMPFYYICKTHSVPGCLKLRYGEGPRLIAGVSFTCLTVMVSGASMFAVGLFYCLRFRPGKPAPAPAQAAALK
jgi:hypothetical protein